MKPKLEDINLDQLANDPETLQTFQKHIEDIVKYQDTFKRLQFELKNFEINLADGFSKNEFIDLELARNLYLTSLALLSICQKDPQKTHVPFSLAAISYFVCEKDARDDFGDIDGFEDDKQVLDLVIEQFELQPHIEKEVLEMKKNKESESA